MRTFKDSEGREWLVSVTVDAVKRVRGTLDVDLLEAASGDVFMRLASDPILLCDVLYVVCKPQADERQISDENFGRSLNGDVIERATDALLEDLIDFFPQGRRKVMRRLKERSTELTDKAMEKILQRADDPVMEELMEAEIEKALGPSPLAKSGKSSGGARASSVSGRDRGRSAS